MGEQLASPAAQSSSWNLGELVLTYVVNAGAPGWQRRQHLKSYLNHWSVVLTRKMTADGVLSEDLSLRSLTLPLERQAQDSEVITLFLPRDRHSVDKQGLDDAPGLAVSEEFAPLLAGYMDGLVRRLPHVAPEHAAGLEAPTRALVAACVAPRAAGHGLTRRLPGTALIDRALAVVRQNMASPDFGPEQLARLLAISRSKLYRLFGGGGGVAHFINRERLHAAHGRLNSHVARSIHVIGNEVGFTDHSAFSRAFRREFGYSPTEARERGCTRYAVDEAETFVLD
jgi:AraC-like DNA-binding protein